MNSLPCLPRLWRFILQNPDPDMDWISGTIWPSGQHDVAEVYCMFAVFLRLNSTTRCDQQMLCNTCLWHARWPSICSQPTTLWHWTKDTWINFWENRSVDCGNCFFIGASVLRLVAHWPLIYVLLPSGKFSIVLLHLKIGDHNALELGVRMWENVIYFGNICYNFEIILCIISDESASDLVKILHLRRKILSILNISAHFLQNRTRTFRVILI